MELKDFVRVTLLDIAAGVHEANEALLKQNEQQRGQDAVYFIIGAIHGDKRSDQIAFDVAVTTKTEKTGSGKAGLHITVAEAGIGSTKTATDERVSRIRFSVLVATKLT